MAEEAASAAGSTAKDIRFDWIQDRVCSSLKGVTQEGFQKLLQGEARCAGHSSSDQPVAGDHLASSPDEPCCCACRAAFLSFVDDPDTKRLLVYADGRDLGAVRSLLLL